MGLREGTSEYLEKQWRSATSTGKTNGDDIDSASETIFYKYCFKRSKNPEEFKKGDVSKVSKYVYEQFDRPQKKLPAINFDLLWEIMYGNGLRLSKDDIVKAYEVMAKCPDDRLVNCVVPVMYSPLSGCSLWIVGRNYYDSTNKKLPKVLLVVVGPNAEPGDPVIFDDQEIDVLGLAKKYVNKDTYDVDGYYEEVVKLYDEKCLTARDTLEDRNPVPPPGLPESFYDLFGEEEDIWEDMNKQKQGDEQYYRKEKAQ